MPPNRFLDYDAVKRARTGGVSGQVKMSYTELAKKFGVSESAVYYACNPAKRRRRKTKAGTPRQVYADDHTWAQLRARAGRDDVSVSLALLAILYHEDAEPLVRPLVEVEKQEEVLV